MMEKETDGLIIDKFSPHLFWDVSRSSLDMTKDKAYIIKQVLEYGLINDWKLIQNYYGIKKIGETAKSFRELDDKSLSFIATLSKTPKKLFRCYNYQQSIPQHWNF